MRGSFVARSGMISLMPPAPLAITDSAKHGLSGVILWSAILVVLLLACFAGYTLLRRWMRPTDTSDESARGFTLSDLRAMHRRGELSDAEYEATRSQMLGAAKRAADRLPPVLPRPPQRRPPSDDDPADEAGV